MTSEARKMTNREKQRRYRASEHGKANRRDWLESDAGKASIAQTAKSDKRKLSQTRNVQSDKGKETAMVWRKSPNGKDANARMHAKRQRNLGYNPINNRFDGSEGHHLNKSDVVHIPKGLHRSITHSILKDRNMKLINDASYEWLCTQGVL